MICVVVSIITQSGVASRGELGESGLRGLVILSVGFHPTASCVFSRPTNIVSSKNPNVRDTYYIVNTRPYLSWVQHRQHRPDSNISQADKVVPLLKQAGAAGMSRRQLAGAIDLPPSLVDGLLAALLDTGQIRIDVVGGIHTYRA